MDVWEERIPGRGTVRKDSVRSMFEDQQGESSVTELNE